MAATPIPSTLPLLATGLAALGLLGWHSRRRKAGDHNYKFSCVRPVRMKTAPASVQFFPLEQPDADRAFLFSAWR